LANPMPQTLKSIAPTMRPGNDPIQTNLFVRLTPLTAAKKEPITRPVSPDRPPRWMQDDGESGMRAKARDYIARVHKSNCMIEVDKLIQPISSQSPSGESLR